MTRTRAVPRRRPNINFDARRQAAAMRQMEEEMASPNVDFEAQRVAGNKEIRRRVRVSDVKIKFLLPQVKNVEVKDKGRVVRKMKVQRVAKHGAKESMIEANYCFSPVISDMCRLSNELPPSKFPFYTSSFLL